MNTLTRQTLLVVCGLLFIGTAAIFPSLAPSSDPEHRALAGFSLEQVQIHLRHIAKEPHPTGSEANDRVRAYIAGQLQAIGLQPEVQTEEIAVAEDRRRTDIAAVTVRNVMAKIEGHSPTRSVVLMSHYDSEPYSPGANDDGAAVAAMLETARMLASGDKPKNDVVFLFTDAEELGMLGAEAFWNGHRWAKEAGIVLNFEARGSSGASLLFETSEDNGRLIEAYAELASFPVTSSVMSDIKRFKSNDTDMSVPSRAGVSGLNFAYVDGWTDYHTPNDKAERVDRDSLFHHSVNMVESARYFAEQDLTDIKEEDRIFFTLLGTVVHYRSSWGWPITMLAIALLTAILCAGWRRERITIRGVALGVGTIAASALTSVLAAYGLWCAAKFLWAAPMINDMDAVYQGGYYWVAFWLLAAILFLLFHRLAEKRVSKREYMAGVLIASVLLLVLVMIYFPGGSYLLAWPVIIGALCWGWSMLARRDDEGTMRESLIAIGFASPALLVSIPILYLSSLFLDLDAAAYAMALTVLLMAYCWPALGALVRLIRVKRAVVALSAATAAILGMLVLNADYNESFPKGNNVFYLMNEQTNSAQWVSKFEPDAWTSQFVKYAREDEIDKLIPNYGKQQRVWTDEAPLLRAEGPRVRVVREQMNGSDRTIDLHVTSPRGARFLMLQAESPEVIRAAINGKDTGGLSPGSGEPSGKWRIKYYNFPAQGVTVTLQVRGKDKIRLRAVDGMDGLPDLPGFRIEPRSSRYMPMFSYDGMTFITRVLSL